MLSTKNVAILGLFPLTRISRHTTANLVQARERKFGAKPELERCAPPNRDAVGVVRNAQLILHLEGFAGKAHGLRLVQSMEAGGVGYFRHVMVLCRLRVGVLARQIISFAACRPWLTYGDDIVSDQVQTYGTIKDGACYLEIYRRRGRFAPH
jgi:hypothetical protein